MGFLNWETENDSRTAQEKSPHPELAKVRNLVQEATGLSRTDAAAIANKLTHRQCDKILKSKGGVKTICRVVDTPLPAAGETDDA